MNAIATIKTQDQFGTIKVRDTHSGTVVGETTTHFKLFCRGNDTAPEHSEWFAKSSKLVSCAIIVKQ